MGDHMRRELQEQFIVEGFNIKDFIAWVDITRNEKDDCEYEVSEEAMITYKKYPCYKKWDKVSFGGSIYTYYKNSNYDKTDSDYSGAYLLKNGELALTADILTSITKVVNKLLKEKYDKKVRGEQIKYEVLNNNITLREGLDSVIPYIWAFAYVYYWCGNMMPVITNWKGQGDVWDNKLSYMIEDTEKEDYFKAFINGEIVYRKCFVKELYKQWIYSMYNDKKFFINENFLQDFFLISDNNMEIKKAIKFKDFKNDKSEYDLAMIKKWFLDNTKLIIQRSYRINYEFGGSWDEMLKDEEITHGACVQSIFEEVFVNKAHIDKNEKGLRDLF